MKKKIIGGDIAGRGGVRDIGGGTTISGDQSTRIDRAIQRRADERNLRWCS